MPNQKILITGGGGFVGSHLAEAEIRNGNQVVALDLTPPDKVEHLLKDKNFRYVQGDILNKSLVESLVKEADLIYHLAAIACPKTYIEDPLMILNVNLGGLQLIIETAYRYNKKFVFSSSSEIYGKNLKVPWHEDDDRVLGATKTSRWVYSTAKAVGEHYCYAYAQKGLKMAMCRFFNFYGPRLDFIGRGRVMPCFLEKFLTNQPVEVVEPGDQTRCFTYIDDGIEGILKVAHLPEAEGEVFNLGAPDETTILELAQLMKKIGNFQSNIVIVPAQKIYGEGYEDIFRRVPDITKAKQILKWEPKTKLKDGLEKTINYYKDIYKRNKNI